MIRPWQITEGGPIILLQVENEYGSYGNDRVYLHWLHDLWRKLGVTVPFSTGDGATPYCWREITVAPLGLDPGWELNNWDLARRMKPGVRIFKAASRIRAG